MSSYRQQINAAAQAQLVGKTIAGANVFTSLDRPLDPASDLPAVMVYTTTSRRGKEDYGQSLIPRIVTVSIEGAVLAAPGAEIAAAEALADAIETAMEADPTLGSVVNDCNWQQSMSDATSHGSHTMGVCLLQYEIEILTRPLPDGSFEFSDDEFPAPPTHVTTDPRVSSAAGVELMLDGEFACGPDGCDIPAWQGDQP